ncbi:fumarate hydratase [Neisseria sp. Ec49-e6-T10]|uniref:fumarate hydratase n=1 Tax=Neisseria sp. Ec49-e6-T10 TaxID=3140744 RepID=UPI003EB834E0
MKEIHCQTITEEISKLCISSNCYISEDIQMAFVQAKKEEKDSLSQDVLDKLLKNAEIAKEHIIPICQDTGMTVVFIEIGQDVRIIGGDLNQAINHGVAKGYEEGYLRKSVVNDPIKRVNTGDNTPAVIHYSIVTGDHLKITVSPKGFGSENMSALKMFKPSHGLDGVKNFVIETVKTAGPNPCPPIIVGVGVGGTMEKAAIMAKQGLLRTVGTKNEDPFWQQIEEELLESINQLQIGPAGLGGRTTALTVHITPYATHIAGLPVAVNIGCHVTRHAQIVL